jgi:hypothetical protein
VSLQAICYFFVQIPPCWDSLTDGWNEWQLSCLLFPSYFLWLGGGLSYSSRYSFCTCWSWIYCFFYGVVNRCYCWSSYCFNTAIYPYWRDYFLLRGGCSL